jgi:NADH-quinone oxidoreductase subunit A
MRGREALTARALASSRRADRLSSTGMWSARRREDWPCVAAAHATRGSIPVWPLGLYAAVVVALVATMLAASWLLGQQHSEHATSDPYESGVASTGGARLRLSDGFYPVAVAFVVFDLEAVFLFGWAIAARELGWTGYVEAMIFVGVLVCALVYLWRRHTLEWGVAGRHAHAMKEP